MIQESSIALIKQASRNKIHPWFGATVRKNRHQYDETGKEHCAGYSDPAIKARIMNNNMFFSEVLDKFIFIFLYNLPEKKTQRKRNESICDHYREYSTHR
jgi:hypothetical protein